MNKRFRYFSSHSGRALWLALRDSAATCSAILAFFVSILALLPADSAASLAMRNIVTTFFHTPWAIVLVLLVIFTAALIIRWPRLRAVYKDTHSHIELILECCDFFEQDGLRVIQTVDTFDTDTTLIAPQSLHGAFLQRAKKAGEDIVGQIEAVTNRMQSAANDTALPGRTTRYPLGTVCPVHIGNEHYCFVAFTHLQHDGTIAITRKEYIDFLMQMWRNLAASPARQDVINVTVMGNRFVDLPAEYSTEQKIDLMIQTFFAVQKKKQCCKTLRICVHENDIAEVDFAHYHTIIEHLAKRPVF